LDQILVDASVSEDDGEFYVEAPWAELESSVFRVAQALTRIHDLSFLNRLRNESSFYEDLREAQQSVVGADYPVDYYIDGGDLPCTCSAYRAGTRRGWRPSFCGT